MGINPEGGKIYAGVEMQQMWLHLECGEATRGVSFLQGEV